MIDSVRDAFLEEKKYQEEMKITCKSVIDGYTDFIFVNRFGKVQHQGTLNKALKRIMRDCNDEILEKADKGECTLLPKFSCHTLRHTFATRLCESGVNMKVIQDVQGHADICTTMNIYTDATNELKQKEITTFGEYLNKLEEDNKTPQKESMVIDRIVCKT